MNRKIKIPADFPVRPLRSARSKAKNPCMCQTCGLWWDDGISTAYTPTPGPRCPFEFFHTEF